MASHQSYTITTKNNITEKEGIDFLLESNQNFINPDKESRKLIMDILGIDKRFIRAFDLVLIPGHTNLESVITIENIHQIVLIELKTTKKKLVNNPRGFFFGATQNEFDLAEKLNNQFKFCFVSLHSESKGFKLLTLEELNKIIKNKRIQYQINLQN